MRHSLNLDLRDAGMQEARARLAAKWKIDPEFDRRIAEAAKAVAPEVPLYYTFTPGAHGKFVVKAVTASDLGIKNEK